MKQNERFLSRENKLLLLSYLCSELQAASILAINKPSPIDHTTQSSIVCNLSLSLSVILFLQPSLFKTEKNESIALKGLLIALGFGKPPASITWPQIWVKVEATIKDLLSKLPQNHLGKPMLNTSLSAKQWSTLAKINRLLNDDFKLRREMLVKRLDVTIQSFKWADRLKSKNDEIARLFDNKRKEFTVNQTINFSDLLAARDGKCELLYFYWICLSYFVP